jgi:DNA-binding response OmpR family regulator
MAVILVVDDEAGIRNVIRRTLERAGHEVVEAVDGEQAMGLLGKRAVDLAIMDVVMPRKGGIEALLELRRDLSLLKVILISGKVDIDSDAFKNLSAQFRVSQVMAKPFNGTDLLAAVDALLKS